MKKEKVQYRTQTADVTRDAAKAACLGALSSLKSQSEQYQAAHAVYVEAKVTPEDFQETPPRGLGQQVCARLEQY